MPIDDALKGMGGKEANNKFLELALARIEGLTGVPLEKNKKMRLLENALDLTRIYKQEGKDFYHFEGLTQSGLIESLNQRREIPALKSIYDFSEADIIFCYFIGTIEDRNRLLNENFYPASGHDFFWGFANRKNSKLPSEDSKKLINNYNFHMGIPRNHFKPIRLPTDLMHMHMFNTTVFQYFED